MRPAPLAAGFQFCRPGSVSRAANVGSAADAKREKLSAMPLAVTHLTNSRRDGRMLPPLGRRSMSAWHDFWLCTPSPEARQSQLIRRDSQAKGLYMLRGRPDGRYLTLK